MIFLYWLADIRCTFLDFIMSVITYLGDEIGFMAVALFLYWCIDKNRAYYIFTIGFIGTVMNQCLKMTCRVSRPWIKNPDFKIVENAREAAVGYSFPSGHTQNAVGTFGGVAATSKRKWVKIVFPVLSALVAFSRMYLGVHTPYDVGFSIIFAIILIFTLRPVFEFSKGNFKRMNILLGGIFIITFAGLIFIFFICEKIVPDGQISEEFLINFATAKKNAVTMMACIVGLWISYIIDSKYVRFDEKACTGAQIFKFAVGIALLLCIKEGLKPMLGTSLLATGTIYFLLVIMAGAVYPMAFPYINKMFLKLLKKREKE